MLLMKEIGVNVCNRTPTVSCGCPYILPVIYAKHAELSRFRMLLNCCWLAGVRHVMQTPADLPYFLMNFLPFMM